jgi:hypothetical protein
LTGFPKFIFLIIRGMLCFTHAGLPQANVRKSEFLGKLRHGYCQDQIVKFLTGGQPFQRAVTNNLDSVFARALPVRGYESSPNLTYNRPRPSNGLPRQYILGTNATRLVWHQRLRIRFHRLPCHDHGCQLSLQFCCVLRVLYLEFGNSPISQRLGARPISGKRFEVVARSYKRLPFVIDRLGGER